MSAASVQDWPPNFRDENGRLFLVRCFACRPDRGRENWAPVVADGTCAWCGWNEDSYLRSRCPGFPCGLEPNTKEKA